jgi:hypothetical protein
MQKRAFEPLMPIDMPIDTYATYALINTKEGTDHFHPVACAAPLLPITLGVPSQTN